MTLFFQQWYGELLKLFARKRTYIGFGVFSVLQVVILVMLKTMGFEKWMAKVIAPQTDSFEYYISALTLAFIVVKLAVFILGGIYLTLVAGDIVAKEAEDGHLRLLLARPVSRFRLLLLKYLTANAYAVLLILFLFFVAFLLGIAMKGLGGGFFAFAPEINVVAFYDWGPGIQRYMLAGFMLGLGMTTISSIAFFLSCFPIKPAAATIGALSYALVDMILRESRFMESREYLLLTKHIGVWARVLVETIDWPVIARSYAVLFAVNITLFTLGYAVFESRDLKS
jgi:ABC-2 type transport system permease protein